jgi:hypothetical protein
MKLKERLQHLTIKRECRRLKLETFAFPASMQGSKRIMITLPQGIQTNSLLLRMITELPVIFPSSDLMIAVPTGATEIARKTGIHAMSPDLYANTYLGLPKKEFLHRVREFRASVLIDFETRKNVFNALVSLHSGASLRIGLADVWGIPVHNFLVRSGYQTDELKVYRSVVDLLTSIQLRSVSSERGDTN